VAPGRSNLEQTVRNPERVANPTDDDTTAKLLLVVLCVVWGVTWPIMRIALSEVPPFTMRTTSTLAGGLALFGVAFFMRRNMQLPGLKGWLHVAIASLLNVASFSVFSTFAQLSAPTSRVAILSYTMPIWTVVLAWLFLGERPARMQSIAIGLCIVGLAILIYPLTASGVPIGVVLALATGVSWGAGTIYLKWARIDADPMAIAFWQIVVSLFVIGACMVVFEGGPDFHAAHFKSVFATVLAGLLGTGTAYGLWFTIIRRLPAMTASLGILGSPVVGVFASMLLLGERPTITDVIGFVLILGACACALLARPAIAATAEQHT
jgi:drug/metabolite transporter (DMT)-like permease